MSNARNTHNILTFCSEASDHKRESQTVLDATKFKSKAGMLYTVKSSHCINESTNAVDRMYEHDTRRSVSAQNFSRGRSDSFAPVGTLAQANNWRRSKLPQELTYAGFE
jgi:hypothetical protein